MTTPMSKAPYKITKRAGTFTVVNNGNEVKAKFTDRDKAVQYLRALYTNVPNAKKRAAKVGWTGKQKRAVASDVAGPWTIRELWHAAVAGGWQRVAADMSSDADGDNGKDTDEDVGTMAGAIDALLDEVLEMLNAIPDADLTPELRQAIALLNGAEPITDQLLELLGVDDPDDPDEDDKQAAVAKPSGGVAYADPGYQKDKAQRYPIDSRDRVRSAWSAINLASYAVKYTPAQRETIKARIRTAAAKFMVDIPETAKTIGETLDANAQLHFDQKLTEAMKPAIESAVVPVEAKKTKPGKHRYISTAHVKSSSYRGAGWGTSCVACGGNPNDPDHDGDMDTPGMPDDDTNMPMSKTPVAAAETTSLPATFNFTAPGTFTITSTSGSGYNIRAVDRPTGPLEGMVLAPVAKAFLSNVNGKTLITGPAATFVPTWEKALTPNQQMLWLQGRFVGAEKANRNGAFWSTGDLELGETTVKYGPLNWLHEAKHIIGTIADTRLVAKDHLTDEPLAEPYIQAASAIWSWIYRDESSVVEMASDSGKLWYSMECISKNVECVGDTGCGMVIPYMEYVSGEKACEHMLAHTATRRFADPTFLGGAVIMPPARPGWAEADAQVMREAASLAEAAFEQAGQPDIPASEWEQLMAGVVRFAS